MAERFQTQTDAVRACREKILSNEYRDLIVEYSIPANLERTVDLCQVELDNFFRLLYVSQTQVPNMMSEPQEYQYTPKVYGLLPVSGAGSTGARPSVQDPVSLEVSGITRVSRPPLSLTGRDVLIVYIGSGIDYTLPAFRDAYGNTRIRAIWDQNVQEGTPPEGFLFGTEYGRERIQEAIDAKEPYSIVPSGDESGQGNAMLGLAAGSALGSTAAAGAAVDAQLAVVKLKQCKPYLREYYRLPDGVAAYAEQDIMLAVQYADGLSDRLDRPVVIMLGLGTNLGSHDGSSPLALYLNRIAVKRSRAVVVAGGDEGNASHHYRGQLRSTGGSAGVGEQADYQDVELRVAPGNMGFVMELWGSKPDTYGVAIRTPGGETIPVQSPGLDSSITYDFVYERSTVTVSSIPIEPSTGDQLLIFRIVNPTEGIWNFRVFAGARSNNGNFHMWLPIKEFLSSECYFLEPDPDNTLTEPAMALEVIGVSAYNDSNNSFYIESGRGFSRTGQVRPDMAAPGVGVSTPVGRKTGTSLAAAITAGAVAQYFQWSAVERNGVLLESKEVKNYFIRGAARSPQLVYPNREWGYGRLDVAGVFDEMAGV